MTAVRSRILSVIPILAAVLALGRSDALARDTDKSWEFGAFVMLSNYAGGTHIDPGTGFGVRGGYHFKAIHELEAGLDRVSADHEDLDISYDMTKITLDYLRMFFIKGHEKMTPYAAFGVGQIDVDDGTESSASTTYRAGGGFKYFIGPRWGYRFDVRIYRWHGHGDVVPQDPFFSVDAQIGLTFLVGGAK